MVIEDEASVRDVWVDALVAAGFAVVGFVAADEALARMPELLPDLILLDMLMPRMDGFEFLARLRSDPAWARVPVLIVSGLGDDLFIDGPGARSLGVVGVLSKPIEIVTLLEHVRQALRSR